MPGWLTRLLDTAVEPSDDEVTVHRKRLFTGSTTFIPPLALGIGVIYLRYGEWIAGGAYVLIAASTWLNLMLFLCVHRRLLIAVWATALPPMPLHLAATLALGDLVHSGGIVLWGLAWPVATGVIVIAPRWLAPLFALYTVNLIVAAVVVRGDRSNLPSGAEKAILLANLLILSVFAVSVIALFVGQRDRAYRLLGEEQRKVRTLLLSILPEKIADELTTDAHVIADQFDDVSVLFADVVDFTPMSAGMTPVELVEVLDELFARFDGLVHEAGLEKIKTIGDCYMVAAGIPVPRVDHATALTQLALDMLDVVASQTFAQRRLRLRIGINSGSVVAGVIGRRKFSYDLWGDVVNTASRMESHGVPDAVQVTASTRALLAGRFSCVPRGTVDVKGKGDLPVWLVTRPE